MSNRNAKNCKNKTNNSQSRKRNFRGKNGKEDFKLKSTTESTEKTNDPGWYAADTRLLEGAAAIPYSWAVGTHVTFNSPIYKADHITSQGHTDSWYIPGHACMHLAPSAGWSADGASPLNTAANAIYAYVRHANAGHSNYDAPDLMLYLMAMSSLYSSITWAQRMYGICMVYSQENRYLPDGILGAWNVDANSIRNNLANFAYGLNVRINKAATFAVPSNMAFFNRKAFIFQNLYCESSSVKDQLYSFAPDLDASFWKFQWDETHTGSVTPIGIRNYFDGPENMLSWENVLKVIDDLLNPLIYDEDINIMSGDILKAYGAGGIMKLATIDPSYATLPLYDLAVLEQFKNARVPYQPSGLDLIGFGISQSADKSHLIHKPQFKQVYSAVADSIDYLCAEFLQDLQSNKIITTESDPTAAVTMENTRLIPAFKNFKHDTVAKSTTLDVVSGTEVPTRVDFYYFTDNKGERQLRECEVGYNLFLQQSDTTVSATNLVGLCMLSNFKFAPEVHIFMYSWNTGEIALQQSIIDNFSVDSYAVVDSQDLEKMHEAALLNMMTVPSVAKLYS